MTILVDLFAANPLLLLFLIAAISDPLGRFKVKGTVVVKIVLAQLLVAFLH